MLVGHLMRAKQSLLFNHPSTSPHRRNAGQSLVEFALLLPLLALLLVGVFDLGRAFHALITLNNAGREAEAQNSGIVIASGDIALTCPDAGTAAPCARDTTLLVTITHQYDPILSFFFPSGVTIRSRVEMRIP
jgi:hypothetical protein